MTFVDTSFIRVEKASETGGNLVTPLAPSNADKDRKQAYGKVMTRRMLISRRMLMLRRLLI